MKRTESGKCRHGRTVKRLCGSVAIAAVLLFTVWAIRALRPGGDVFLHADVSGEALPEELTPEAIEQNAIDSLGANFAEAARRLNRPLGIGESDLHCITAERFFPDGAGGGLRPGRPGAIRQWLRRMAGREDDMCVDITVNRRDTLWINCTALKAGDTILRMGIVIPLEPSDNSVALAGQAVATVLCSTVNPLTETLLGYDIDAAGSFERVMDAARLYDLFRRNEPALQAYIDSGNRNRQAAGNTMLGALCENFGLRAADSLPLRQSKGFYRKAMEIDPSLAECLQPRIDGMERQVVNFRRQDNNAFLTRFFDGEFPLPDSCRQLIAVYNDRANRVLCAFRRYEKRTDGYWAEIAPMIYSNVGQAGIAPYGEKREGDMRTPSGAFPIGFAFGYAKDIDLKWPFVVVTPEHYWISDSEDPLYNRMTTEKPRTDNFEYLRRNDDLYKYAAVINYNMNPIEKHKGSAIFFHIERGFRLGSAGCITVTEPNAVEVLQWLDPDKSPYMLIGTLRSMERAETKTGKK